MAGLTSLISPILTKLGSFIEEDIKTFIFAKGEMKKLKSDLEIIEPFIEAAERQQLGTEKALRVWLRNLKHICYNIEDAVDEWNSRILKMKLEQQEAERNASKRKKVRLSLVYPFRRVGLYAKISRRIKVRKEELDKFAEQTTRYITRLQPVMAIQNNQLDQAETTHYHSDKVVPVREEEKKRLFDMLLPEDRPPATPTISSIIEPPATPTIISIIGPGGIGKSTLAKEAYNDPGVNRSFYKPIWVWVSKHFDMRRIAGEIVAGITGETPKVTSLAQLLEEVEKCVKDKKVLLILDNVWIERRHDNETSIENTNDTRSLVQLTSDIDHWFQLKNSLKSAEYGSKILVTTRSSEVAEDLGSEATKWLPLEPLSKLESEKLFEDIASSGRRVVTEELRTIGKGIASKCKGLPLAIKCLAELCRKPDSDWETILESPIWTQKVVEQEVFRPLMISYCYLEPSVRRCILYCAMLPKGSDIQKENLIELWMAQGFLQPRRDKMMEAIGLGYFNYLKAHHFFEDKFGDYRMHDIVHDFITYLSVEAEEHLTLEEQSTNGFPVEYKERVRHCLLSLKYSEAPPAHFYDCRRLRSLMVRWPSKLHASETPNIEDCNEILNQACDKLLRLRILSLSNLQLRYVQANLGKLILLRYLNLSGSEDILELPQGICDLINLQTLDISECRSLKKLPDRIGDLTNLIHLLNEATSHLEYMPKGIRRLTKLQTLSEFVVGNGENAASLEDLGYLTNLQGEMEIRVLSNVDDKQGEAQLVKVGKNIVSLILNFTFYCSYRIDESVFQPSLSKALKKVVLSCCRGLEQLPPLGQLPSLEYLLLEDLPKVRKIGVEVLGIEGEGNQDFIAFPRLESLRIEQLTGWEEWNFEIPSTSSRTIRIMPCLRLLNIADCYSITEERVPPQILDLESLRFFQLNDRTIRQNDIPIEEVCMHALLVRLIIMNFISRNKLNKSFSCATTMGQLNSEKLIQAEQLLLSIVLLGSNKMDSLKWGMALSVRSYFCHRRSRGCVAIASYGRSL